MPVDDQRRHQTAEGHISDLERSLTDARSALTLMTADRDRLAAKTAFADEMDDLIERSSFGSPASKAHRDNVDPMLARALAHGARLHVQVVDLEEDVADYRHVLNDLADCDDNCERCRRLARHSLWRGSVRF
jgi:hypothetical protein